MPHASLKDVDLHYALAGDQSAPVLVLSNSLGTTMDMWQPQLAELSSHFQVLRYDTRGHGQSSVPQGPYSVAQLGEDVIGLLDHLNLDRVHFCGLSMGGITGMWLALNHADRIHKLVLSNTAAYIGPPENWTNRAATVQKDGMASIADSVVARWLTPDYAQAHAEQVEVLKAMLASTPADGYAANCIAVRDNDLRQEVGGIRAPTLVISGTGDMPTPPSDGKFLHSQIQGSEYLELDAAHLSNQEQVSSYTNALIKFLSVTPA
ncbi:3-oxoadipate enol-lactonase [Pollutimonas subterranea]|uniref:3-oxoadipate enol-lactonase n=1 Tax=Pollutimonas subterranea TaxID=2045210 RepID=A0A2N4U4W1_9BURK|nr:3-oxoadipate enol-lactonase [Pollutimonas subterranea]PLC50054.1 3-oxoadipate enol-lactonase [Pollutimonas subterranea]